MENTIALVDDPAFLGHVAPAGHPERPERLGAAQKAVSKAELALPVVRLPPRDATLDELARVHTFSYLDELEAIRGRFGHLDADTFFTPRSYDAAVRAAGGAIALVDALIE